MPHEFQPYFSTRLLSLSHPISIVGIIVVLLNDHWWRRVAPSWFTGKVGDFAWLIFAPFLLALLLAWLMPRREKLVGYAAIVGVGLIFGLAKTVPAFHALTINVLEFLTGWPNVLRMDPTDLIALPALLIAWWIWQQSAARSIRLSDRGWVLLPLAVFATMADSAQPDFGINCVEQVGNQTLTYVLQSGYYASQDGGLSWTPSTQEMSKDACGRRPQEIFNSNNPLIRFRFGSDGRQIDRTEDGGRTWQTEYVIDEMSEAQQVYTERTERGGSPVFSAPLAAVMDATTGNLIVAAGHQGVAVRTPDGEWHAIGVGQYYPIDLRQPGMVVALLAGEFLFALVVFALAAGTMAPGVPSRKVRLMLVLGWLALCGAVGLKIMFLQGNYSAAGSQFSAYGAIVAGVIAVPAAAIRLIAVFRFNPTAVWVTFGLSALAALLFLVPLIVWSQNGIPSTSRLLAMPQCWSW